MEMVSVSKLKTAESFVRRCRAYGALVQGVMECAGSDPAARRHPLLRTTSGGHVVLYVVTSDTGLCSSYNIAVERRVMEFLKESSAPAKQVAVIGKKGFDFFRARGIPVLHGFLGLQGRFNDAVVAEIYGHILATKSSHPDTDIYIAYTRFGGAMHYEVRIERLLPVSLSTQGMRPGAYYIEPEAGKLFDVLIPLYVKARLCLSIAESFTAEHSSRAVSMKSATDNAKDLMKFLILQRNKLRQSAITKEVIECISSVEALKG
jgi:F-type H+-transporting ATPase subunit gamma